VATGGTTGQFLSKASGTNFDTTWATIIPGDRYLTSSTTSLTINNADKTLTIGTGLSYSPQQDLVISETSNPTNRHMHARVTSYNSGTGVMVVNVISHTGSGTYSSWVVNVGGATPAASTSWGAITGTLSSQTDLQTALDAKAALASPTFTGVPAAPTATAGTSTTQLATTAFVTTAANLKANIASPTFTGVPAAPTATAGTNTTQLATTAFVTNGLSSKANLASPTFTGTVTIPAGASISGFAPLASPALTGTPTAPTASTATNTTQIATTAYVKAQAYATLASPTFTGTVTIPAGASISGYLTTASASATYYPLSNPSGFITSSALTGYATESWVTSQGYLTDAPSDGNEYVRKNAAWAIATGGGGGVAWGAITGTVTDQTDLVTYVTGLGYITDAPSDGTPYARQNAGWVSVAGGTAAADQLTAGVVATNPTTGPTASGDVLQYDGTNLIWAAGGGGGGLTISSLSNGATSTLDATVPTTGYVLSFDGTNLVWAAGGGGGGVAWGAITGTLSTQTDLQTALDAKQNKSTLVTHSVTTDYYVTSASENGVVYLDPSSNGIVNVFLPDNDPGFEFANGCSVTIINRSGGFSPVTVNCYGSAFAHILYGNGSVVDGFAKTFYKISGNDWFGA
jgi:hypothetical protein